MSPASIVNSTRPLPGTASVITGGEGISDSDGVTAAEASDSSEEPTRLNAATVKVYEVRLLSPSTRHESLVVVEQVKDPGLEVTTYLVMALVPSSFGAVQDTRTEAFLATTLTSVGASGEPGSPRSV